MKIKEAAFLNRTYNDLDIQMPLIAALRLLNMMLARRQHIPTPTR